MKTVITKLDKFNQLVANYVVEIVSTMWCAYAFSILVILPFFNGNLTTIIMFISSSLLQLVLLPIIMVGQKKQGDITEQRAQQDHEAIIDMHEEIKELLAEERTILDELKELLARD